LKPTECHASDGGYLGLLACGVVLLSLGASPVYTLGTTLIDDNTDPKYVVAAAVQGATNADFWVALFLRVL
jgi:hypothetical protein